MELVTLQSEVWQSLLHKLQTIHEQLTVDNTPDYSDLWLNEPEVCDFLGLSARTMSRMRKEGAIAFAKLHGKYYYTIGEIKRVLENRRFETTADYLDELTQKGKNLIGKGRKFRSYPPENKKRIC